MLTNQLSARNTSTANDPGIPVLVYHHLLKDEENVNFRNKMVITPAQFAEQMKYLHDHKYQTISLTQLEQYLEDGIRLPDKSVVITFDDGYLSNYHYAYPILKQYNFHAVIFAITGSIRIVPEQFDPDQLNYISWSEINRYTDVFEVQAHTHEFHQESFKLSYLIWRSSTDIMADLHASQRALPSQYFAYPYGQYTNRTIRLVQDAGYRLGFTIQGQRVFRHSIPMELGRFWIGPDVTLDQFIEILQSK